MSAQSKAWVAASRAGERRAVLISAIRGTVFVMAVAAAGCTPATTRVAGADPADPAARVAGVGYRSTTAPYTSLRPSTPAPWRERNEGVTPKPRRKQP